MPAACSQGGWLNFIDLQDYYITEGFLGNDCIESYEGTSVGAPD